MDTMNVITIVQCTQTEYIVPSMDNARGTNEEGEQWYGSIQEW